MLTILGYEIAQIFHSLTIPPMKLVMMILVKYLPHIANICHEIAKYLLPVLVQNWENVNIPMLGKYLGQY